LVDPSACATTNRAQVSYETLRQYESLAISAITGMWRSLSQPPWGADCPVERGHSRVLYHPRVTGEVKGPEPVDRGRWGNVARTTLTHTILKWGQWGSEEAMRLGQAVTARSFLRMAW